MTQDGATVSLTSLLPFLRLLEERGAEHVERAAERGEEIFTRWGIASAGLGEDLTRRLPHDLIIELLLMFVDVLGDPAAPLLAGQKLQPGDYELLEYLCATTPTLGECIACLGRYYPLLIDAEHDLEVDGERAEARFRIRPGLKAPDCIHEFALASNFQMTLLHMQLEGSQLPLEVTFAHPEPGYAEVFAQVFFAPVRFGAEHNAIVFPAGMLAQPMKAADPTLHGVLTRLADQELQALSLNSAFPATVREVVERLLRDGAPMEQAAERLHISASTLRTRLRQHGTSYSAIVDTLRRDLARRALRQSQKSVSEIAYELGFKNPPAFHRAFRRWFGITPTAMREARSDNPATRILGRGSR
ncbi:MAG: AraC family transcriptional regulator ligand-binding domain-containing protein [Myxococcales bacterium]|jgi:AraC-like DNA-binding protein